MMKSESEITCELVDFIVGNGEEGENDKAGSSNLKKDRVADSVFFEYFKEYGKVLISKSQTPSMKAAKKMPQKKFADNYKLSVE